MLLVQFLLGMWLNLFVELPRDHPGSNASEYFGGVAQSVTWAILHGPILLVLHATLGLLVVGAAFSLMVQAIRSGPRPLAVAAGVGAVSLLAAGFNGGSFLNYHEDFSSMIMAIFFAIAMGAYAVALFIKPTAGSPSTL